MTKGMIKKTEFKTFSMDLAGRPLVVEIGRVAAQANGAAFMHYGDTVVLSRYNVPKENSVIPVFIFAIVISFLFYIACSCDN